MKLQTEIIKPDKLICSEELLFNKGELNNKINTAIQTVAEDNLRSSIANVLSDANVKGRLEIQSHFEKSPFESAKTIASYSFLKDKLISLAFDVVQTTLQSSKNKQTNLDYISIIAVGGYGRAEMAPHSDVDLLFLTQAKPSKRVQKIIEDILYILWDMRLKIGYSTRSTSQCIQLGKTDQTIKTALLEHRYLCGNKNLYDDFCKKLRGQLFKASATEYVEEKLEERAKRHERQGGQRYMVEPNVKEGKGGLRDLQSLFWITKYISHATTHKEMIDQGYFTQQEYDNFLVAHNFLWAVRCHLHICANRASEQLTFDHQVEVAKRFGYKGGRGMRGVERFMQDYFRQATHVGELTRVFLTALEAQQVKSTLSLGDRFRNILWRTLNIDGNLSDGFQLEHGRINIINPDIFLKDPINILRLFEEGLKTGLLIHQDAMRVVTANLRKITPKVRKNPETQRIFMSLLLDYGNPERALRRMNELGVLGAIIPEFKRIIALMQFNFYHSYTVDEHTIQCISFLARIEQGTLNEELPIASEILKSGVDRRVLYIAILLHDIGKGLPEDHSIAGAELARKIAPELGLNASEADRVIWLVENHLVMSDFAQKRDLSDPKTVSNFGKIVKTTSNLNLLTVLTVCDIMGVGPGALNNWKAQLLRELYTNTRNLIKGGLDTQGKNKPYLIAMSALSELLIDWDSTSIQEEVERHYPAYWQGLDTNTQYIFANLFKNLGSKKIASHFEVDEDRDATRAQFLMQDHPGIFSRLTGAIALANANVIDARTYTTSDGYATPVFWIQDNDGKPFDLSRLGRLKKLIDQTLSGDVIARDVLKVRNKLKPRERNFKVPTDITFDNQGSDIYTIIEVDTRDRHSLLFDLTRTLANANIQIASAVIATYGAQAVDVFYVKDMIGLKITSENKQNAIKDKLQEAIELGAESSMA
ncbi:[protein-PII] uridylyltransferase [Amylibacter sp.]|nr:[protein-PII] uridylyltransferase [Amylibacter sp.]|tara:strand:- start:583 stop:3378 length:2796 start_codon:yes stop_codon:yes gene_type:complete